ncbi:MAG: DNA polymerase I [Nitrospirota bacterium]|jgi:DNA polymerase-1
MAEVYLIDGAYYLYRAFYAMRELSTSTGLPTNATLIFARMLLKLLKERRPDRTVIAFDAKGPTFRNDLYADYKGHRPPMPDDLRVQIPYIHRLVEAMGIPTAIVEGVEADDVLGTLALHTVAAGDTAVLVTRDKDLMQLIDGGISMWDSLKDEVVNTAAVEKKFGIGPRLVPDCLALIGDTSDNIPGVPGVGPKGAAELLQAYGDLEGVLAAAPEIKAKKRREALIAGADQARLSKELATIRTDVDLSGVDLTQRPMDRDALRALFAELEFTSLPRELGLDDDPAAEATEPPPGAARFASPGDLANWLTGEVALHLWLEEEPPGPAELRAIQVGNTEETAYALVEDPGPWLAVLAPWLGAHAGRWLGHGLKPQLRYLAEHEIAVRVPRFDTALASYLLDASRDPAELADLAAAWLQRAIPSEEAGLGKGKARRVLAELPEGERAAFLRERGLALAALAPHLENELAATGLDGLYGEVEGPLQEVLCAMEVAGIAVDRPALDGLTAEMEEGLAALEEEIYDLAGEQFNINSPKQLATVLYDGLDLPVIKRTKTGPSTDVSVLEELGRRHPLPAKILDYRSITKLLNTYVTVLPTLIAADGRIHSRFHQTVAATGRLSSSHPNLQNIPIRTERGRTIRRAFVAPDGYRLLSADYSQIELRLLAHFSGDEKLIQAFVDGADIHRATAAQIFGLEEEQVTDAMRRDSKTINFGILYGMGAFRLAQQIDVPLAEAKRFIEHYFARYPKVRAYLDGSVREARETGYVTTLLGRRRPLPEVNSDNRVVRANGERMAINTPLQGSAADIIKVAMLRVDDALRREGLASRLVLQVHDELVLEVPDAEADAVREMVPREMGAAASLKVPLVVDTGVGDNWDEAH